MFTKVTTLRNIHNSVICFSSLVVGLKKEYPLLYKYNCL